MNTNMYIVCNLKEEHIEGVCAYIVFFLPKDYECYWEKKKIFFTVKRKMSTAVRRLCNLHSNNHSIIYTL